MTNKNDKEAGIRDNGKMEYDERLDRLELLNLEIPSIHDTQLAKRD